MISISSITKPEQKKLLGIAAAALTLLVPYLIHIFDHGNIEQAQSLCVFKMLTGLPCPGCGITKSIIFFYQGELYKSLSYHIFGPAVVLFCLLLLILLPLELFTKKSIGRKFFFSQKLALTLALFLGIYHLVRLFIFLYATPLSDILKESIWQ
ncbi:MAG: DUF2752 domain-containing protein [Sphingomonadales bacterium]